MRGSASQAGFYYQNNIAALKIIECLFFDSEISHILLENYDKGNHIDDVIIYRKKVIDYYQVKWSNDGENTYSLYNLLIADKGKKSLFKQLAEGYLSVKDEKKDFSITLFTTKKESGQRRPSKGINHGLKNLRSEIFDKLKTSKIRYDKLANYTEYKDTLEKVRTACGLNEDDFNSFIKKLDFKFSQESLEQIQNVIKFRLERLGLEENLFEKLLDKVVKWSISGDKITKEILLNELGISDRFEDKISHYFKVIDNKYYVPNTDLDSKLEIALDQLDGGYIFIEGLPGIGKSTALTKFKETRSEVILAYYCYIPDAKNNFGELRHQSYYFLKSLCISIEKQFPDIDLPNKYTDRYDDKLDSYLDKLSTVNRKIIFIIDGLDHVDRDTALLESSLLKNIKGQLPKNIYFILSSQYKTVLSPSVETEIDSDSRRHIKVSRFSQVQIQRYLRNKGIEADDILDQIEKVSNGIPLYLHYITELFKITDGTNYAEVLKELPNLNSGEIDSYHQHLYQKIENNAFVKWVLAVLAYRKENSTVDTIVEILNLTGENKTATDVTNVLNNFSHLLRVSNGRAYSIFHNSFREFILSKTTSLKEKFNTALVAYYELFPFSDEAYRNYFKHLFEIGGYDKIIKSTTIDWLKSAWRSFRTIEEIKENLEFAINSCTETLSLSSFIRISFIKEQFSKLSWNLENCDIDFSTLLLNAGEIANSLRSIWDGDFVLANRSYFCYYLEQFYIKTGQLPSESILHQGLSMPVLKRDTKSIASNYQMEALVYGNTIELFAKIDSIKWIASDEDNTDYHKGNLSDKENARNNLKIKLDVIDHLYRFKKYSELSQLSKNLSDHEFLRIKCNCALVKLLLPNDKKSATSLFEEIQFGKLSDKAFSNLLVFSCDYLTDSEVFKLFPKRKLQLPRLKEEVIEKAYLDYKIHKEIINSFDRLKPIWIYEPDKVNQLLRKVSVLSKPAKNLYDSIFTLSELWYKSRTKQLSENAKFFLAKQSIKSLCVSPSKDYRKVNRGLFDMNSDDNFIARSIKGLYKNIFSLSSKIFSVDQLNELVSYWLDIEKKENKYRDYAIGLAIAKQLNQLNEDSLLGSIQKLIRRSEEIARYEEETATLVEYIGEISEVYGICGYTDDFKRLYDQLFEISFGVGYRKDYQASNIISPLELIHKTDPKNTLSRLSDVFEIQNQLSQAGNGRMQHICLSYLISFVFKHYPQLAFDLIEHEENNLVRGEALDIILEPSLKNATNEELQLYFTLIKTLPRWGGSGNSNNHFLSLSIVLLKRAIELNNKIFIEELIKDVREIITIELEAIDELKTFSSVFEENGIDYNKYELPQPLDKKEDEFFSQDEKSNNKYTPPQIVELIQLFESNYSEFEYLIQSNFEICLKNRRIEILRNEFDRSKSIFEKFFQSLPRDTQSNSGQIEKQVIRNYIIFNQKVMNADINSMLKSEELQLFFDEFVLSITPFFPDNTLMNFIQNEFDNSKWIDNLLRHLNEGKNYMFSKVINEEDLYNLVNEISILQVNDLLDFIRSWTFDRNRSICLLKVANRLVSLDIEKAKGILSEIIDDDAHNRLFPDQFDSRELDFDILESILKIDKEFGKKFALKNYLSQKNEYSSLTASLSTLLKYRDYFNDEIISETFYNSNLEYNRELAYGLPKKENNYDFVMNHNEILPFGEVVIKYLVGLFDNPVVKIRELALQALFDHIVKNHVHLESLLKYGIESGTDNQIEHTLIVLSGISVIHYKLLLPYKDKLISISNKKHFNILETAKELILYLDGVNSRTLTVNEKSIVNKLNTQSPIILEQVFLNIQKENQFLYSEYQVDLLNILYQNEEDSNQFHNDLYGDLVFKELGEYNSEKEGHVHRLYNINSNFDTIEIQSTYYDEVKSSINKIYNNKIKRGCFDNSFVQKSAYKFRIYDPSKLLYKIQAKPKYIEWLPDISEENFNSYNDIDALMERFINRESDYITLAEFGSQRPKEEYSEKQFTSCFEVFAYLKKEGFDDSVLDKEDSGTTPYLYSENSYAFELSSEHTSTGFPIKKIKPLLEVSINNFRGEQDLINANLLSDIFKDLKIEKKNLLDILMEDDENYPLKAFRWQRAYTSSGRRRYKPTSEGFTLKVKKEILEEYLSENGMELCYEFHLRRSTTKYRTEIDMEWYDYEGRTTIN